jgi:hypothetical protein
MSILSNDQRALPLPPPVPKSQFWGQIAKSNDDWIRIGGRIPRGHASNLAGIYGPPNVGKIYLDRYLTGYNNPPQTANSELMRFQQTRGLPHGLNQTLFAGKAPMVASKVVQSTLPFDKVMLSIPCAI